MITYNFVPVAGGVPKVVMDGTREFNFPSGPISITSHGNVVEVVFNKTTFVLKLTVDTVIVNGTSYTPSGYAGSSFTATTVINALNSLFTGAGLPAVTAASYSAMVSQGLPSLGFKLVKVAADENLTMTNSVYLVWPDGTRTWIGSDSDSIVT